jgi:glutamate---cysteine ligase / carboxylate-amine ligase
VTLPWSWSSSSTTWSTSSAQRKDVEYVHTILREGTSADRQLAAHQASDGDMRAVVDHVTDEALIGVPLPA